jgi:hypothetical protein
MAPTYNGFASKDACWRAQFRNGSNGAYNEAQYYGHIASSEEATLCGYGAAYSWDGTEASLTANGTKCKYKP